MNRQRNSQKEQLKKLKMKELNNKPEAKQEWKAGWLHHPVAPASTCRACFSAILDVDLVVVLVLSMLLIERAKSPNIQHLN